MDKIIGRDRELDKLQKFNKSGKGEFIALYGRRRVGKTSLIRFFYKDTFDFYVTGIMEGTKSEQEEAFHSALVNSGYHGEKPRNWKESFTALGQVLDTKRQKKRCVVFIDEIPCFDTERSGFVKALGDFWNRRGSWQDNLILIICGSATSWMIKNVIDNKGGLHNRITHEIHLKPFTLFQTECYVKAQKAKWSRLSILQIYMVLGGIPYYLSLIDYTLGAPENIDNLFFSQDAELRREYDRLYTSLYKSPEKYIDIIRLLSKHKQGLTRNQISNMLSIPSGTALSEMLKDLVYCDFIRKYNDTWKKNDCIYQIVDFFSLFYEKFCTGTVTDKAFWRHTINTSIQNNWYGLAFERVCICHIEEMMQSLHIDTILTSYYSWRSRTSTHGAQIDLIVDRADGIINIFEMKYFKADYRFEKDEYLKMMNRIEDFRVESKTRKGIQAILVTTFALKRNDYSDIFGRILSLDDLFVKVEY